MKAVVFGTPVSLLSSVGYEQVSLSEADVVASGWLAMPVVGNYMRELTDPLCRQ